MERSRDSAEDSGPDGSVEEYFAYTVSYHPSSPFFDEYRHKLLYSNKELPVKYTGFAEGHLYFPKIVSIGELTNAHVELYQTCVDCHSSDSELREDAACDMDVWSFSYKYLSEGSKRMSEEGARGAYYLPEEDYMLVAFPLWEVYSIPSAENNIDEDILCVKTWSKKHKRLLLEVVYPFQLLGCGPNTPYPMMPDLHFTFGSMRFVRKFIPHRQEIDGKTLRDMVAEDAACFDEIGYCKYVQHEKRVTEGIDQLMKFAAKRDEVLEEHFQTKFETQFWERTQND